MKKSKFRTQKALYLGNLILCLIGFIFISILNMFLSDFGFDWLYGFLVAAGLMILPAMLSAFAWLGRSYYTVIDGSLLKIKGKNKLLNVSNSDVIEIEVIKMPLLKKFLTPFWFMFGNHFCDMIAIKFSNCNEEYDFKESRIGIGTKIIHNEDGSTIKYNVDLLSFKEAKELASLINCPIRIVENFDF